MGAGKMFFIFILLMLLISVLFLVFGNKYAITKPWHDKLFNGKAEEIIQKVETFDSSYAKEIVNPPASETDWCKIQDIAVPTGIESYSKDAIIGWDAIAECCVRKVSGYNCALDREGIVEYCYTGNVGGEVLWAMVDGYFVEKNSYKAFIEDLDKTYIENKQQTCNITKYPALLKPVGAQG